MRGAKIVFHPQHVQEGVLAQAINIEEASGLLAARYAPERYQEFTLGADYVSASERAWIARAHWFDRSSKDDLGFKVSPFERMGFSQTSHQR